VTRDDDIDVVRHALEQPQPNKVVLNRVSGVVEHRNQDIRQHVARHENPTFFDQQRRMAGGMSRMLNIPDSRPSQGPVLTSPRPALFGAGGMAAILEGTLAFDGDCLRLIRGDIEYPVVWPAGASWEPDPPSVVLLGQSIEPGATVSGEGGYLSRDHVEQRAGSQVADAAARCAGSTGEIAFFNIGSEIEVTSG
jgi:hypothetical protein